VTKRQFRVLYRQFLFRLVDLEVLSAHAEGDARKLLGRFASLLVFVSVVIAFSAGGFVDAEMAPDARLALTVFMEHFLIATTMLVVGIFAVLSWDSIFPDLRDVQVLAPLPLRGRTMFLAKVAASATALGLVIALLHSAAGLTWPLAFAVQATPQQALALTFDPTPTRLSVTDLKPELDRALRQARTSGWLAPGTGGGLAIGVSQYGVRRVFAYGAASPDSLFEIGSISKTFTGLMLARMVEQGKARFDEPVRELLPAGTVSKPAGREISLVDLATHHSGLPAMPDNFLIDRSNPCGDYRPADLYAYLAKHGVERPPDASFLYSNLGLGLLGQALAERGGMSYPNLLREEVTGPLGLRDTVVLLSSEQTGRFMRGYDADHRSIHSCDLDAEAGAGGIRSTANDMLTYLEANLHPDKFKPMAGALIESHRLRAAAPAGARIALAWAYVQDGGVFFHNGATPGFGSMAFFDPTHDRAVVVLINIGPNPLISAELLAGHIGQRLSGAAAISLDTVAVPASSGFPGLLRWFAAYWFTMLAAGAFVYFGLLGVQGLAAQILPRRLFLRSSGWLQLTAFCLFVAVYFLEPGVGGLTALIALPIRRWVVLVPSYWFLGLFHELNGSMHPVLGPLASRAWIALGASAFVAAAAHALSWMRTLRQIVEQPEISSGPRSVRWLPRFGTQAQTAIGQFAIRTLARSRQHRLILAFYWGIGLAVTIFLLQAVEVNPPLPDGPANQMSHEANTSLLAASVVMLALAIVGVRVVFALPLQLPANWIFRSVGVQGGPGTLAAARRALVALSLVPVWLVAAVVCLQLWPWREATAHLAVLGLLGVVLTDLALHGFHKIPFACSYLPGKSPVHMVFLAACGLTWLAHLGVTFEQRALEESRTMTALLVLLALVAAATRWATAAMARSESTALQFEEAPPPAVMGLGLHRDGVMIVGPPPDR
jgi:CubicO group peptidase (beta-lactamase class C family)